MLNEFELIDAITKWLNPGSKKILKPIGDDCACVKIGGKLALLSNDEQIENTHFKRSFDPHGVGYKLIAANVSDIYACGGKPKFVNLALAVPSDLDERWIGKLYDGINEACMAFGVSVTGGNTTRSDTLAIGAFIVGTTSRFVPRSGAKAGDLLYVSAPLGASRFGLERLLAGEAKHPLTEAHLYPKLPSEIVKTVRKYASACIDISDGFLGDLRQIAKTSGVGFRIDDPSQIADMRLIAELGSEKAKEYALYGGEEYQLLFTAPRKYRDKFALEPIGEALEARLFSIGGVRKEAQGFDHFAATTPPKSRARARRSPDR
ncbi:thiamine-monophosphate kinase [Campylobacterota bacterium]|nr:thiamine-monophosphate kinase [Campylobacterota bacterium]